MRASETDDAIIPVSAAAAAFLIAIVLLLVLHKPYKRARQRRRKRTLVQGLRKDVDNLKEQVALSGFNVASSSYHSNPLRIYLTETMHTAAKLDELQHISELVEMGADPSVGDEFDQSVHASLLESYEVRLRIRQMRTTEGLKRCDEKEFRYHWKCRKGWKRKYAQKQFKK